MSALASLRRSIPFALALLAGCDGARLEWQEYNGEPAPASALGACEDEARANATLAYTTIDRKGRTTTPGYVGPAETGLFMHTCMMRKGFYLREVRPLAPGEFEAGLSQALNERRYADLDATFHNPGPPERVIRLLAWTQTQMLSGEGAFIALSYSGVLMALGEFYSQPKLKDTAAFIALYAQGLALTEAVRCADRSAAQVRMLQVVDATGPMTQYLLQLPLEERQKIVEGAILLEDQLAPRRRNDDWLCRGGVGAITSALGRARPGDLKQIEPPPGLARRTFTVPPNPDYRPAFLAESEWRPRQIEKRAEFQKTVRAVFLKPGTNAPDRGAVSDSALPSAPPAAPTTAKPIPPQIAKAPAAFARQAGVDGDYGTTVPANLFNGNPPFEMRITAHGSRISGYGTVPRTPPMQCNAKGTMGTDGDAYFAIDCATGGLAAIQTFQVSGRFAAGIDGMVVGNTNFRLSSGPSGTPLWRAM